MFGLFRSSETTEATPQAGAMGLARVDRRTKNLTKRLQAGEVAIIDHEDLDRVSAEALVRCAPVAVVNASRSTSGRYPNLGPQILLDAGIPLVDGAGPEVMDLREGSLVYVGEDGRIFRVGTGGATPHHVPVVPVQDGDEADSGDATDHGDTTDRPEGTDAHSDSATPTDRPSDLLAPHEADGMVQGDDSSHAELVVRSTVPPADLDGQSATLVATGTVQSQDVVDEAMAAARAGLSVQIEAFAENTMDYIRRERDLLLDGVGVPDVRTRLDGRHVLVVVRGYHYKEDLSSLRSYIRENRPVLIGVDGGADAILEMGYKLDMIVGDMDSVSDKALTSGAEVVVHAYRNGRAPGRRRVEELGVEHVVFPAAGTSEDVAMLLADDKGAELIVALGTHATLIEFLDKGRSGMSSTFLTRLRVGSKLVDAKGVSQLYRPRISTWQLWLLALAGLLALFVSLAVTPVGQTIFGLSAAWWDNLVNWFQNLWR